MLFEREGLPYFALPASLETGYGGPLGFAPFRVIGNFVASVDGVVVLRDGRESGHIISGGSEADRFVMGLLRSFADAVLIGAGTLSKDQDHRWTPAAIYPKADRLFQELRLGLRLPLQPTLVVVTASGAVNPAHPALSDAIIATTAAGASALRHRLPPTARILAFERSAMAFPTPEGIPPYEGIPTPTNAILLGDVLARLRAEGLSTILTEGGPKLFSNLLAEKLVDELFLTLSPRLFGRYEDDPRRSLVDGHYFAGLPLGLLSARRHGAHLFLRYALKEADIPGRKTHSPMAR